jgi:hypothetical protein
MDNQKILDKAKKLGDVWLKSFKHDGKVDIQKIQEILNARTFNGQPVKAFVARTPKEASIFLLNFVKENIKDKREKKEAIKVIQNSYSCIWDYYLMAFYESAILAIDEKSEFPGSEFIFQSLLPAFQAGLGYLINLGELVVGVCIPEAYVDNQNRLHKVNGPAIVWDTSEYWWHGVKVEKEWIENPESITGAQCLSVANIEQRRALCEIIGWNKVLESLNPTVLDKDDDPQIGILMEADLPDHGKQRFLKVFEESTGRSFVLLVSNDVSSALDAQVEINQIPAELFQLGFKRS